MPPETYGRERLRAFRTYGFWGGLFVGALIGIIVGGPRFKEWSDPMLSWAALTFVCGVIFAVAGYIFLPMVIGSEARSGIDVGTPDSGGLSGDGGDAGGGWTLAVATSGRYRPRRRSNSG